MTLHALKHADIARHNDGFLEHFTDHLIMAFAFFIIGAFVSMIFWKYIYFEKVRIDYELEKGTLMRVYVKGKRYLIVNPSSLIQWVDVALISIFDTRNKEKYVSKQHIKRFRIISVSFILISILSVLTGVIMLFSALETDVNIFNWFRGYRPWN